MTFEEYCNKNNLDYTKLMAALKEVMTEKDGALYMQTNVDDWEINNTKYYFIHYYLYLDDAELIIKRNLVCHGNAYNCDRWSERDIELEERNDLLKEFKKLLKDKEKYRKVFTGVEWIENDVFLNWVEKIISICKEE